MNWRLYEATYRPWAFPGKGGFGGRLNSRGRGFCEFFFNGFLCMGVDVCRKDDSGFG